MVLGGWGAVKPEPVVGGAAWKSSKSSSTDGLLD